MHSLYTRGTGYVLGEDPKRVFQVAVPVCDDTLGTLSKTYQDQFVVLCTSIYNVLRQHGSLFTSILQLIEQAK